MQMSLFLNLRAGLIHAGTGPSVCPQDPGSPAASTPQLCAWQMQKVSTKAVFIATYNFPQVVAGHYKKTAHLDTFYSHKMSYPAFDKWIGFNGDLAYLYSGPCIGDTLSSSPSSTPMGSLESLSSHSSEQNNSSKMAPSAQVKTRALLPQTLSELSNGYRSAAGTSSLESSSREEAKHTDVDLEDTRSLSSFSTTPRLSSAPKKAPHCRSHLSLAMMYHPDPSSMKSLHLPEGNKVMPIYSIFFFCQRIPCYSITIRKKYIL